MPAPTDADARAVVHRFRLLGDPPLTRLGNAGGFSGAALWRVQADVHDLCLKALPVKADLGRHAQIAALLYWTRRECNLNYVPEPRFVSEIAGRGWEMVEWMPGTSDFHTNPSAERLCSACVALARLHIAWERYTDWSGRSQPCPGVLRRIRLAREWCDLIDRGWRPTFAPADAVTSWADRAWAVARRAVPDVLTQLQPWQDVGVPVQLCVCDVWHDHVL